MSKPNSFREIIDRWPERDGLTSLQAFSADIGVAYGTAQVMRHRDSIAPDHFPALVEAAATRGTTSVTLELLHVLRSRAKERVS